ncbi:DUF927 domain-containing protein [Streptomyces sp. NPDC094049]|uniref:DUF927 domain-containing protein n=1 Tax=Streptomyces sp. NPDC094049 TaxID=3154987 RepID=UPI003327AC1A
MSTTTEIPAQTPKRRGGADVKSLGRDGVPPGCRSIAGMKRGWFYQESTRAILFQAGPEEAPTLIGYVPEVTSTIAHVTDDGEYIRTEYLARGRRQKRPRILTEDELDRGTWSAKCGQRRPTGNDERHAYARLMREQGDKAPEVPARTHYNEAGDLVFPEAEAQTLGYRVLRGEEKAARDAWDEIGAWTCECGKSALVMGAMFAGPVLDSLDVLAHMINVFGPGQQGKSTILTICAGTFGDIKPRRQQLMITWNASKQGITQSLRQRGFLPLCLDEHSSSGRRIQESSREISQMVAGAIRSMGTADGSPRESDGFWLSCAVSSSNEPLKHEGQTEDLATRLQEFEAPFFPDRMLLPDGSPAPEGHAGAEHVSKRLKRLSKAYGGWPLEWAIRKGMFRAENLERIKTRHLELCAKYRPASGGIAATIAELHMVWVVGAYMLGEAIGVPEIGKAAEAEAAARLSEAITVAAETNVPDHEKLWGALDALRLEKSAFPDLDKLPSVAEEGFRRLRGFLDPASGEWWVLNPVVQEAGAAAGVDNVTAALRTLDNLGVHIRGTGKNAQRKLPQSIRGAGLGERMHCFNTRIAAQIFAEDDDLGGVSESSPGGEFPRGATPWGDPGATGVAPENSPLTCTGATGATGATPWLLDLSMESGTDPRSEDPAPVSDEPVSSGAHGVTSVPDVPVMAPYLPPSLTMAAPPTPLYPPARMHQPGEDAHDRAWFDLGRRAKGRTVSGMSFGVLGDRVLLLPNHGPVSVPMPGNVDQAADLMRAYGLKTLWVHAEGAAAMGLPTCEERRELPQTGEREDQEDGVPGLLGPQDPVAHPWVVASGSGLVSSVSPGGLASWLTLVCGQGEQAHRLSVALPLYDTRYDKDGGLEGRGGFGGPASPADMLDALMVWTLSTVHGQASYPRIVPFYASVNRTAEDLAGGRGREDVLCQAVRRREVAPFLNNAVPLMVPQKWHRVLTEAELTEGRFVHRFDKTAAWLGAFSNTELGVGEPEHHQGDREVFDRKVPGAWRVAGVPGHGPEGLPPLRFREADGGGYWVSTPSIVLLQEQYPGWTPEVVECWVWPEHKRALSGMYDKVRISRGRIVNAIEDGGHPGAVWAKQINGRTYQSFRGYLARSRGPLRDHTTGGDYSSDIYYRPDWARLLMDTGTANLYRNLVKYAAEGHVPLAVAVDAVTYVSTHADPEQAKPSLMPLGASGGQWTHEGSAPLDALADAIQAGKTAHTVLDAYLDSKGE